MNREQLEEKALDDHRAHRGVIILVTHLYGYNERDDSVDLYLDPPVRCRVERTRDEDICHWNDEWLDPYWDVTPLDVKDPILAGIRSCWTHGPSYNHKTGATEPPAWKREPGITKRLQNFVRRAFARGERNIQ